jgi:L,D-transpeptidase catalytic domain
VISLAGFGLGLLLAGRVMVPRAAAQKVSWGTRKLRRGQFTWEPDRSPEGPVAIIVSVPEQRVYVYRNGIQIAVSTCSTGKSGHDTPTGVFTILEKEEEHYSSKYDDAPMPNMQRLTWDGIALHAGKLPGYPASHGCVRLPAAFAKNLYAITTVGTPVIISGDHTEPIAVKDPGPILGTTLADEIKSVERKKNKKPQQLPKDAVTSILVSRADSRIYVLQNGDIVAQGAATIADPRKPLGSQVFVYEGGDANGSTWQAMGFHPNKRKGARNATTALLERIQGTPEVMDADPRAVEAGHRAGHHRCSRLAGYPLCQGFRGDGRTGQLKIAPAVTPSVILFRFLC